MSVVLGEEFRMAPGRSIRSGALQVMAQGPGDIAGQPPQCGLGTHQVRVMPPSNKVRSPSRFE